jgi:CRP-like cAMP-binding protein
MRTDGIWGNIFRFSRRQEPLIEILHNVPLFREFTEKELRVLEGLVHVRTYQPGEAVFVESEPGAGMYVIRSGRVDIKLKHRSEQPLLLAELQTGDFFGEMALLGDSARSATAMARERSDLIGFFHPDLEELMELHPMIGAKIAFGLAHTLAERLRYTNSQLREVWEIRGASDATTG